MKVKTNSVISKECRVEWTDRSVLVGNGLFSKAYASFGGVLRTTSFKATAGSEWQMETFDIADAELLSVTAEPTQWSPSGVEGVRVEVRTPRETITLYVFPGMPGVISICLARSLPEHEHDLEPLIETWKRASRPTVLSCGYIKLKMI